MNPADNFAKYSFAVTYSIAMFTEIFIPAYFGTSLIVSSAYLPYDIFKSNWIGQSEKFKQLMKILAERTLRPIAIHATGIFELNLTNMLKVITPFVFLINRFSY